MIVVGLDLSLRAAGVVRCELPWSLDFKQIESMTVGYGLPRDASEYDRLCRLNKARNRIASFCSGAKYAIVEQYAFSRGQSQAHALGELGGVVKLALHDMGIEVVPVVASHVRACLGKFPRKDTKAFVEAKVREMGCPKEWSADEIDAFVCLNGWAVENGHSGLMVER